MGYIHSLATYINLLNIKFLDNISWALQPHTWHIIFNSEQKCHSGFNFSNILKVIELISPLSQPMYSVFLYTFVKLLHQIKLGVKTGLNVLKHDPYQQITTHTIIIKQRNFRRATYNVAKNYGLHVCCGSNSTFSGLLSGLLRL